MRGLSHPGSGVAAPCNVNEALEGTTIICRNDIKHVADVILDLDPALPEIEAYSNELGQVWLNLVVNAVQALKVSRQVRGGERGFIAIRTRHEQPHEIMIEIEDSGVGITAENLERIFDPFFTTKDVGEGTGQGLAIVHDIVVTKHGGRIDVISRPGEGTCFTIILPTKAEAGRSCVQRLVPSCAS
nr:ATP-binding protein [Hongsoonwoonella zoysiae]